jgi:hypothetical protein
METAVVDVLHRMMPDRLQAVTEAQFMALLKKAETDEAAAEEIASQRYGVLLNHGVLIPHPARDGDDPRCYRGALMVVVSNGRLAIYGTTNADNYKQTRALVEEELDEFCPGWREDITIQADWRPANEQLWHLPTAEVAAFQRRFEREREAANDAHEAETPTAGDLVVHSVDHGVAGDLDSKITPAEVVDVVEEREAPPTNGPDLAADDARPNMANIRRWLDERIRDRLGAYVRESGWSIWMLPADSHNRRELIWLNDENVLRVTDDENQDLPLCREALLRDLADAGFDISPFISRHQELADESSAAHEADHGAGGAGNHDVDHANDHGADEADSTNGSEPEFRERGQYGGSGADWSDDGLPPVPTLEEARARTTVEKAVELAQGGETEARKLRKPSPHFYDLVCFRLNDRSRLDAIQQAFERKRWAPRGLWQEVNAEADLYIRAAARSADTERDEGPEFFVNARGEISKDNPVNVQIALSRLGITLRFNSFAHEVRIDDLPVAQRNEGGLVAHEGSESDVLLDDSSEHRVRVLIAQQFGFAPFRQAFDTAIDVLAQLKTFNPVLERIEATTWDRVPRIDTWVIDCLGAEDTKLNRAFGAKSLIAVVRRVRRPGTKFDHIPVLIGPGGKLKSMTLKVLAFDIAEWFTDSVTFNQSAKEFLETTKGRFIAEVPEMVGVSQRDFEHIKAWLSRTDDIARMAYDRHATRRARVLVLFGTTNRYDFLRAGDPERRFWPMPVAITKEIDIDGLRAILPQLYAEAAVREAAGEAIFLDKELAAEAALLQLEHQATDPWEELLDEAFTLENRGRRPDGWTTINEIQDALGIHRERRTATNASRIADILRRLGFERDPARPRQPGMRKRTRRWCRGDATNLLPHLKLSAPETSRGRIVLTVEWPQLESANATILPFPGGNDPGPASEEDYGVKPPETEGKDS